MTDQITRPTQERLRHADHLADDGAPTKEQPHVRAVRIGIPWDRYTRPNKDGRTVLEKHQIEAGNHYAHDHELSLFDRVAVGKFEPSVDGSLREMPLRVELARKRIARADRELRPHERRLLHAVLFNESTADKWAEDHGLWSKSGVWFLRVTLDVLAVHYGYMQRT